MYRRKGKYLMPETMFSVCKTRGKTTPSHRSILKEPHTHAHTYAHMHMHTHTHTHTRTNTHTHDINTYDVNGVHNEP